MLLQNTSRVPIEFEDFCGLSTLIVTTLANQKHFKEFPALEN